MILFQGSQDNFWTLATWIVAAMFCIATWFIVLIGRDTRPQRQRRGEMNIKNFGEVEENHAPIPKFLIYTYIGIAAWGLCYLLWTGMNGVTGYR